MTAGYKAPSEEGSLMSRGEPLPVLSCSHGNINGSGDSAGPKFSSLDFKSGASYEGGLDNGKKCGTGRFTWPNGAWFEGEYANDIRQGKGIQRWADGSSFEGDFLNDMRHGKGVHTWLNGEKYSGMYFKDRRHGQGEYTWPDGTSYTGLFYMEKKEGYGTFKFPDGRIFKGLYKDDEREGPGTLIYPNKLQDVGLWHRETLIRLCNVVEGMFTLKDHPEFDYDPAKVTGSDNLSMGSEISLVSSHVTKSQEEIRSQVTFNDTTSAIFYSSLHSLSLALDVKSFDDAFTQEVSSISVRKPGGHELSPRREKAASRTPSPMREKSAGTCNITHA
ncbi:hypothetical protein LSAT2_010006 [Lamellibrachia satsuma]|nr:hypothetical protein LSAT2_010006 [Lamellibrachia satsuma]